MWKRKQKKDQSNKDDTPKVKDLSLGEVRKAVHMYADHKPSEIPLSVLIKSDLTLDYQLLSPYLDGIPKKRYYMSRETYELFTEENQQLARDLDRVQQAVDQYMQLTQEPPIIEGDPYKKVSYFMLEGLGLLSDRPERDFYLTNEEFMITYKKPS
ncbi:DUF3939 domain-containing protein [Halobacillus amylolyticus]|uniref:DUF3939 domain-containing protein n=1 Tax=Halobacillus amylolyticus TaxID=2932259 RepID=A0ABY4HEN1_9BACI|nr:DUF3939 domain-containing protein [Halobacillus amylolyticus]UOR13184.1 DUF3939 domain-containing protein [Halobacillus amylolyticus]